MSLSKDPANFYAAIAVLVFALSSSLYFLVWFYKHGEKPEFAEHLTVHKVYLAASAFLVAVTGYSIYLMITEG